MSNSRRDFLGALAALFPAARLVRGQEQEATFSADVKVSASSWPCETRRARSSRT